MYRPGSFVIHRNCSLSEYSKEITFVTAERKIVSKPIELDNGMNRIYIFLVPGKRKCKAHWRFPMSQKFYFYSFGWGLSIRFILLCIGKFYIQGSKVSAATLEKLVHKLCNKEETDLGVTLKLMETSTVWARFHLKSNWWLNFAHV